MQREIKKRAQLYGIAAVVSAILLGTIIYNLGIYPQELLSPPPSAFLKTFSSHEELRSFLKTNSEIQGAFPLYGPWDRRFLPASSGVFAAESSNLEYSTTNIQVAGVDEADIVKTDGEHIYVVSANNIFITRAYPPEEAEVLSKITYGNDTYPVGVFASGDRLAVLGSKYTFPSGVYYAGFYYAPFYVDIKTFVNVYDISDRAYPVLLRNFTISGSYFNSRMIGDYVYIVASQPAYLIYDTVVLPKIYTNEGIMEISASQIHYSNATDNYFQFTTVVAINMQYTGEEPTHKTMMLGGTSSMYVSLSNIYITFPEPTEQTSVYRLKIDKNEITPEAQGEVPGNVLNQFSMDEYNNYFRIATTKWVNGTTRNNLYILNMSLSLVGSLENIAPDETIDSARFLGNRCYLSTSVVRRDPFFVIDVKNASNPKILGYLKIPGFTRYLHPYDEDHVIGVGRDNNIVKISLFDVSNVTAPVEMAKYIFTADAYSDTPVLTEHKAFLFDKSKDLLALPVSISNWDLILERQTWWQGAYVFTLTLTDGFDVRGTVTHQDSANPWDSGYVVKRVLYVENVLYTVSDKKIKMNSLEDLTPINEVSLS